MKVSIGKNTLGGGQKMTTNLNNYNRSTHDLSYVMRTTMAPGVLVPTMKKKMLPGDTFDIRTRCHTLTHPTIGPLFGSFKQQNDFFFCPDRLYQAMLHNNALNVGMNMGTVKMPRIKFDATDVEYLWDDADSLEGSGGTLKKEINPSSLIAYLGLRSARKKDKTTSGGYEWQCLPLLMYFDIFKNYYANKQEEKFYIVSGDNNVDYNKSSVLNGNQWALFQGYTESGQDQWVEHLPGLQNVPSPYIGNPIKVGQEGGLVIFANCKTDEETSVIDNYTLYLSVHVLIKNTSGVKYVDTDIELNDTLGNLMDQGLIQEVTIGPSSVSTAKTRAFLIPTSSVNNQGTEELSFSAQVKKRAIMTRERVRYEAYDLTDIDDMREKILMTPKTSIFYANTIGFLQDIVKNVPNGTEGKMMPACAYPMVGLALKTYQSDINVNWVNTEWIEGDNGINAITAIDTSSGSFTIDQLNLAKKVYTMLNRIAVSDGSYNAWIQTVYTSGGLNHIETPIYLGGSSLEIEFQEVINNSGSAEEPLGTLAGRGVATNHKGGNVYFKADEPGYIMCITSLTPRVDYFQGNDWDMYLDTMDDLHKPQLDGIGFQDRLYQNVNANADSEDLEMSIGKQPAWIEYMTAVNQTYGNFALIENEGWMCLNRIFEGIDTYTTYVQPHLYNNIFADTEISAQNFWVQIGFNIKARRVMSAKQIPNV